VVDDDDDDPPGFVELVAEAEEAMPVFTGVLEEFTAQFAVLTALSEAATAELQAAESSPRPGAARLTIIKRLSGQLDTPATTMEELAEEYTEQLSRVEGGIFAMARQLEVSDPTSDELAVAEELYRTLEELADISEESLTSLEGLVQSIKETSQLSKTSRPVMRRIIAAVEQLIPSRLVIRQWEQVFGAALAKKRPAS